MYLFLSREPAGHIFSPSREGEKYQLLSVLCFHTEDPNRWKRYMIKAILSALVVFYFLLPFVLMIASLDEMFGYIYLILHLWTYNSDEYAPLPTPTQTSLLSVHLSILVRMPICNIRCEVVNFVTFIQEYDPSLSLPLTQP